MTNSRPVPHQLAAQLIALGDQLQQVCRASGLDVIGFLAMVEHDGGLTIECRSRVGSDDFDRLLLHYLNAGPSNG